MLKFSRVTFHWKKKWHYREFFEKIHKILKWLDIVKNRERVKKSRNDRHRKILRTREIKCENDLKIHLTLKTDRTIVLQTFKLSLFRNIVQKSSFTFIANLNKNFSTADNFFRTWSFHSLFCHSFCNVHIIFLFYFCFETFILDWKSQNAVTKIISAVCRV